MADETPTGGAGDHIMGLGLDIGQYIIALKSALQQYEVFRNEFQKSLSIRLDPTTMKGLTNALGVQMRQAMQLMHGAREESVKESVAAAKKITQAFTGIKGFREAPQRAKRAREETEKELRQLADSFQELGQKAGDALEAGTKRGTAGASKHLGDLADKTRKVAQLQAAISSGEREKIERADRSLKKAFDYYSQQLGGGQRAERLRQIATLDEEQAGLIKMKGEGDEALGVFDREAFTRKLKDMKLGFAELTREILENGGQISRTAQQYENLGAAFDRIRGKFSKLPDQFQGRGMRLLEQRQQAILAETGDASSNIGARGPITQLNQLEDLVRKIEGPEGDNKDIIRRRMIQAWQDVTAEMQKEATEAKRRNETQQRLTREAETQLRAVRDRRSLLPVDRQAKLSPLPAAESLVKDVDGKPQLDKAAIGKLNQEIKEEAANTDTVNKALTDYNAALRAATRTARQLNEKRAAVGQPKVAAQDLIRPGAKGFFEKDQDKIDAINREILAAKQQEAQAAKEQAARAKAASESVRSQAGYQKQVIADANKAQAAASLANARIQKVASSTGLELRKVDPKSLLDDNKLIDPSQQAAINTLTREAVVELREYDKRLAERNRLLQKNVNDLEAINNWVAAAKRKAPVMAASIDEWAKEARAKVAARHIPAIPQAGPAITRLAQAQTTGNIAFDRQQRVVTTPPSAPPKPPDKIDRSGLDALTKGYRQAGVEAEKVRKTSGGIAVNLAQQAANMAKWLFFYKAVHEITAAIQRTIGTFVRAGIDYNRQLEQHQLALRGVLAENFTLIDAQGQQVSGLAALTSLQITAKNQWKEIQQAALSVVGTTSDLMGLYAGVLPFASKLGANLQQVQELTKSAAVAASLLDISFQDARSALISLLQGRALVRNRLVGALGFSREEVASLAGTPELFEKISERLSAFLALSDDASQTFAAMSEQFKDFTGIVASGFTQPLVDLFKDFVAQITLAGGAFALFQKSTDGTGLRMTEGLESFIEFSKAAFEGLAAGVKASAKEFALANSGDLQQWVLGVKAGTQAVIELFVAITKGSAILATFIAENRALIKVFGWVALGLGAAGAVSKLSRAIINATKGTGFWATALNLLTGNLGTVTDETTKTTKAIGRMEAAGKIGGKVIAAAFTGIAIGGITTAIGLIIQKFFQLKQAADSTREAMKAIGSGDIGQAIVALQDPLRQGSFDQKLGAASVSLSLGQQRKKEMEDFFQGDASEEGIAKTARRINENIRNISNEIEDGSKQLASLRSRLQRATAESVGRESLDPSAFKLREELEQVDIDLKQVSPVALERERTADEISLVTAEIARLRKELSDSADAVKDNTEGQEEAATRLESVNDRLASADAKISALGGAQDAKAEAIRKASKPYDSIIERESAKHGLDPDLIRAVISRESGFGPQRVSPKGAQGLMQLMPDTAKELGVTDAFDPEQNIAGGVRYLANMLKLFSGNVVQALAAYNAGQGRVNKAIKAGREIPDIEETKQYIPAILGMQKALKAAAEPFEISTVEGPDFTSTNIQQSNRVAELGALVAERTALLSEKSALEDEIAKSGRRLTEAERDEKQFQIDRLTAQLSDLETRRTNYSADLTEETESSEVLERMVSELLAKRKNLQEQLDDIKVKAEEQTVSQRAEAAKAERAKIQEEIEALEASLIKLNIKRSTASQESERYGALRRELGLILSQSSLVEKALDSLSANRRFQTAFDSKAKFGEPGRGTDHQLAQLVTEVVPWDEMGAEGEALTQQRENLRKAVLDAIAAVRESGKEVSLQGVIDNIKGIVVDLRKAHELAQEREALFNTALEVTTIPNREPEDESTFDPGRKFVEKAPNKIAAREAEIQTQTERIERAVAREEITRAEADRRLQNMAVAHSEFKLNLINIDEQRYKEHVERMVKYSKADKRVTPPSLDEQVNQGNAFAADRKRAEEEVAQQKARQERMEAERASRFKHEWSDALLFVQRTSGQIFGVAEESALASWQKTVNAMRRQLLDLAGDQATKDQVNKLFDETLGAQGPKVATASRATDQAKNAERTLSASRERQGLLVEQLEAGDVSAESYLRQVRDIRDTQEEALRSLIAARETMAGLIAKELSELEGKAFLSEEDVRKAADLRIELTQFTNQAAAGKAELAELLSIANRVTRALQAWANLTGQVREFLSAADGLDGTNTGLETMIDSLNTALGLLDRITASANAFSRIGAALTQFKAMFSDAGGGRGLGGSFGALGSLFTGGLKSIGGLFGFGGQKSIPITSTASAVQLPIDEASGAIAAGAEVGTKTVLSAGQKFAAAIPAIGIGISAALSLATFFFNRGVEKAKKDIEKSFDKIIKGLNSGAITLGKAIGDAERERQRLVAKYSDSKSGRKALKELLPAIDDQIDGLRQRAKDIQKNFEDAMKQMMDFGGNTLKPGPFTDFYKQLLDLEKFVREYLDSINTSTASGMMQFAQALERVGQYVNSFFESAKLQFGAELLGFEQEALGAQERLFSLINSRDGLYRQLGNIAQERLDLEEAVQEEMERRQDSQNKLNDLAKKELEIRKRIADVIRQAAEDEMAIRRRGVLEAQLSIAQQKAMEISKVRNTAQDEIDRLREELAGLQDDIKDETRDNAKKDRDFDRRRAELAFREGEIHREIRLTDIRIRGASEVARIEGSIFGMAKDEFDLAERQNDLAIRQAQIQVQKWRETKALFDAIVKGAKGFFFEPPAGFPQIKVELGQIVIDNSDNSSNIFNGGNSTPYRGARPNPGGGNTGRAVPRPVSGDSDATTIGTDARMQGYGDVY